MIIAAMITSAIITSQSSAPSWRAINTMVLHS
jgi:hypothetical protein